MLLRNLIPKPRCPLSSPARRGRVLTHGLHFTFYMRPQVQLLQVGPRGDLVVGQQDVKLAGLSGRATVVNWLEMFTSVGGKGAEVCVVLRLVSGEETHNSRRAAPPPLPRHPLAHMQPVQRHPRSPALPAPLAFALLPLPTARSSPCAFLHCSAWVIEHSAAAE